MLDTPGPNEERLLGNAPVDEDLQANIMNQFQRAFIEN